MSNSNSKITESNPRPWEPKVELMPESERPAPLAKPPDTPPLPMDRELRERLEKAGILPSSDADEQKEREGFLDDAEAKRVSQGGKFIPFVAPVQRFSGIRRYADPFTSRPAHACPDCDPSRGIKGPRCTGFCRL
jgi:hypothetical protein